MNRPKLKLKQDNFDKAVFYSGITALFIQLIITILNYNSLPEIIPTHYNFAGEADDFGNKNSILVLPIISLVLFSAMNFLKGYPHLLNYTVKITPENAEKQYRNGQKLLNVMATIMTFTFLFITYSQVENATNASTKLPNNFITYFTFIVFAVIIYFFIKSQLNR